VELRHIKITWNEISGNEHLHFAMKDQLTLLFYKVENHLRNK